MLSGATLSASAMAGTAVFRIVVSSDSMKNATATSHGNSRLPEADGGDERRSGVDGFAQTHDYWHGLGMDNPAAWPAPWRPASSPACAGNRDFINLNEQMGVP